MEIGEEREGEEVRGVGETEERESRQRSGEASGRGRPALPWQLSQAAPRVPPSLGAMTVNVVRVVSDGGRKADSASPDRAGRRSRRT